MYRQAEKKRGVMCDRQIERVEAEEAEKRGMWHQHQLQHAAVALSTHTESKQHKLINQHHNEKKVQIILKKKTNNEIACACIYPVNS